MGTAHRSHGVCADMYPPHYLLTTSRLQWERPPRLDFGLPLSRRKGEAHPELPNHPDSREGENPIAVSQLCGWSSFCIFDAHPLPARIEGTARCCPARRKRLGRREPFPSRKCNAHSEPRGDDDLTHKHVLAGLAHRNSGLMRAGRSLSQGRRRQKTVCGAPFLRHMRHSLTGLGLTCGAGIIGRARIERNSMSAFSLRVAQE